MWRAIEAPARSICHRRRCITNSSAGNCNIKLEEKGRRESLAQRHEMATRLGTAACYIYERESQDCFCLVTNTITAAVCILQEEEEEEEGWDRGVVHFKGDPSSLSTTLLSVCLSSNPDSRARACG